MKTPTLWSSKQPWRPTSDGTVPVLGFQVPTVDPQPRPDRVRRNSSSLIGQPCMHYCCVVGHAMQVRRLRTSNAMDEYQGGTGGTLLHYGYLAGMPACENCISDTLMLNLSGIHGKPPLSIRCRYSTVPYR